MDVVATSNNRPTEEKLLGIDLVLAEIYKVLF